MNRNSILAVAGLVLVLLALKTCPYVQRKAVEAKKMLSLGGNLGKTVGDVKWTGCDGKDGYLNVKAISVSGSFMANTQITIEIDGVTLKDLNINDIDAAVKLGFVTLFEEDISYPIHYLANQDFKNSLTTTLYIDAPSGSYKATLRFKDPQANVLQCLLVTFKLS